MDSILTIKNTKDKYHVMIRPLKNVIIFYKYITTI